MQLQSASWLLFSSEPAIGRTVEYHAELGALLFEIAQLLFALEQTFILGAMAANKKKSEEQGAN